MAKINGKRKDTEYIFKLYEDFNTLFQFLVYM